MKKNNKGFTLTEVLVAMVFFALMSLMVCTLYAFLSKMIIMSDITSNKVDSQMAKYESSITDASVDKITNGQVVYGTGADAVTVDVDYKVIDGSAVDQYANPNIKYFIKN